MIHGQEILDRFKLRPFRPMPLFRGGWAQTLAAHFWPQRASWPAQRQHLVELPDGDRVVLFENYPVPSDEARRQSVGRNEMVHGETVGPVRMRRAVLLVHGLTGCCQSKYMIRLTRAFVAQGLTVFRMNLRGCGPGFGLARDLYHSGRSEDTRAVIAYLAKLLPNTPVTQIGFSLGANITLKMAGEDGARSNGHLDSVVAVSPPAHLAASARHLSHERNRLFDRFFVYQLRAEVEKIHRQFPDLPMPHLPERLTVKEFDDYYTAPRTGFRDAMDYYEKCSSLPLIPDIRVRTLILSAMDDPVVDTSVLLNLPRREPLDLVITKEGGHVGFFGWTGSGLRWMDELVLRWVINLDQC